MFTFASFPVSHNADSYAYDKPRHPDIEEDGEDYMNLDFEEEDLASGSKLTYPGESITSAQAFMRYALTANYLSTYTDCAPNRGHGTFVESDEVISSVAGTIERVNKLISVRAVRSR